MSINVFFEIENFENYFHLLTIFRADCIAIAHHAII